MDGRDREAGRGTAFVAGERVDQLQEILREVQFTQVHGGGVRINAHLTHADGACLMRAIMRVEAELLLHDADQVTAEVSEPRTAAKRRADAFVALALRVADAVEG